MQIGAERVGPELPPKPQEKRGSLSKRRKIGRTSAHSESFDPELEAIIEAWPALSAASQAGILTIIRATQ